MLARLPGATTVGASLLHLSCHAVAGETVEASHLTLTEPLSIRTVVEHAAGRAVDAPGALVVLSSCVSDVTRDHFDEALTLATAFLASGAVTVEGRAGTSTTPAPPPSCSRSTISSFGRVDRPQTRCGSPSCGCATRPVRVSRTCRRPCAATSRRRT